MAPNRTRHHLITYLLTALLFAIDIFLGRQSVPMLLLDTGSRFGAMMTGASKGQLVYSLDVAQGMVPVVIAFLIATVIYYLVALAITTLFTAVWGKVQEDI
jgi:hypothetical protein